MAKVDPEHEDTPVILDAKRYRYLREHAILIELEGAWWVDSRHSSDERDAIIDRARGAK